jgi:hypothetical protein
MSNERRDSLQKKYLNLWTVVGAISDPMPASLGFVVTRHQRVGEEDVPRCG